MSLNTKSAAPLLKSPKSRFARMQAAELAWWKAFLEHPTAKQRMWALYGARYYGFFWKELHDLGTVVEIGAGPLPVIQVGVAHVAIAVDTLGQRYVEEGLTDWRSWADIDEIPDGYADTVLLLNVLDHTDKPEQLIAAAQRVLQPDGKVLVFVHLGQEDDKHGLVTKADCDRWLKDFEVERAEILARAEFDPPAYVAVAVKHG